MQLTQTIIQFPEIQLATRDAHKFQAFSLVVLWTLPIVMMSKAFSLLGCSTWFALRHIGSTMSISFQAESLTYHNLGHRPRSGQRPGTELQKKKKQI